MQPIVSDIELILIKIAPAMGVLSILLLLVAALFMAKRIGSGPKTIEAFTVGSYTDELKNISDRLSNLDETDPRYREKLRTSTAQAVTTISNMLMDRRFNMEDEIGRSKIGLGLVLAASLIQAVYLFVK